MDISWIKPQVGLGWVRFFVSEIDENKLAPYGIDGRLFTTDVSANFSQVTQKLGQISKIRPDQI